jgi:hypothetical protein
MDVGVRVALGAATELPRRAGAAKHTTCESGHPWRSDVGVRVALGAATELPAGEGLFFPRFTTQQGLDRLLG